MDKKLAPQPGLYENVTYEDYDSWDAVRPTVIKSLAKDGCAERVKWEVDHGTGDTQATIIGNAFHTLVLQAELFTERYIYRPRTYRGPASTKKDAPMIDKKWTGNAKACQAWLEEQKELGKHVLAPSESVHHPDTIIDGMAAAIEKHEWAKPLLSEGTPELSIVWKDEASGMMCKARLDNVRGRVIVDLKTCMDASVEGVMKASYRYNYHIQAAMGFDGMKALGQDPERYIFAFIRNKPPHLVNVVEAEEAILEFGRAQYHYWLNIWAGCLKTGEYPGYNQLDIGTLLLPPWAGSEL